MDLVDSLRARNGYPLRLLGRHPRVARVDRAADALQAFVAAPAQSASPRRPTGSGTAPSLPGPTAHVNVINDSSQGGHTKASFATFGLSKPLLRAIEAAGFTEPRPIQARTIPHVLDGKDVLGLAQTGMGKTAAFALPILELLSQERRGRTRALILAPTRELAMQIDAEVRLLAQHTSITTLTIFGGVGAGKQISGLKRKPDILVACPGRLLDLKGQGHVDFRDIEFLVLDEADHMFHMGFLPDIRKILAALPARRQNLLFSATMPREIRGLTDRVLRNPTVVELEHSQPAETISHALYPVEQSHKTDLLHHLLRERDFNSAIVFLRTKHRCKRLAQMLTRSGLSAVALQGNMSQGQRVRAMDGFREGKHKILVATDIAARGIDVAHVSLVINYDIPGTPDAYTHRIGRTGRAERTGEACTFVTPEDSAMVREIEKRLGSKIPRHKLKGFDVAPSDTEHSENLDTRPGRGAGRRGGGGGRGGRGGGGGRGRGRGGRGGGAGGGGGGAGGAGAGAGAGAGGPRGRSSGARSSSSSNTPPRQWPTVAVKDGTAISPAASSPGQSQAFGSNIPSRSSGGSGSSERRLVGGGRPRRARGGRGRGRGRGGARRGR